MCAMFDTYDSLPDNYIPNNMHPRPPRCPDSMLKPVKPNKPYEEYNVEGELIGYWWNWGDTLNLEFDLTGDIVVEDNAIIYTGIGEEPTESTVGEIDQKAYNVVDLKSWKCVAIDPLNNTYSWEQDEEFSNPEEGTRNIYVTAADFMKDKSVTVRLFNFRMEQIAIKTFAGATKIVFPIDKKLSDELVKGVYYCRFTIWSGDTLSKTVFQEENCTLTVK